MPEVTGTVRGGGEGPHTPECSKRLGGELGMFKFPPVGDFPPKFIPRGRNTFGPFLIADGAGTGVGRTRGIVRIPENGEEQGRFLWKSGRRSGLPTLLPTFGSKTDGF